MGRMVLGLLAACSFAFSNTYSPSFRGTLPESSRFMDEENPLNPIKNTKNFPYRAIGRIATGCTGTLISARHVLTAAHCVYSMKENVYYTELEFSPGQNGKTTPFGTIPWKSVIAPKQWTKEHNEDYDYALITLDQDIGNEVGWLGFGVDNQLENKDLKITGYPEDKPAETMWGSACKTYDLSGKWISYQCETAGGMSGAGVVNPYKKEMYLIVGVHALGGPEYNSGVLITSEVYNQILKWMK